MKKVFVLLLLVPFSAVFAQEDTLRCTQCGDFENVPGMDSIMVNSFIDHAMVDSDDQRLVAWIGSQTWPNEIYRWYTGATIVRVQHLYETMPSDRCYFLTDCGVTVFIVSPDKRLVLRLWVGKKGWWQIYFFQTPVPDYEAYQALRERPIIGTVPNPDQHLGPLVDELLPGFYFVEKKK